MKLEEWSHPSPLYWQLKFRVNLDLLIMAMFAGISETPFRSL